MMITVGELTSLISTETRKEMNRKNFFLVMRDLSGVNCPVYHTAVLTTAIILYIASPGVSYLIIENLDLWTTLLQSSGF